MLSDLVAWHTVGSRARPDISLPLSLSLSLSLSASLVLSFREPRADEATESGTPIRLKYARSTPRLPADSGGITNQEVGMSREREREREKANARLLY